MVKVNGSVASSTTITYTATAASATTDPAPGNNAGTATNAVKPPPVVGPGTAFPATSEVSDQKAGSVLIYNIYTSSSASPNSQNTRINMTNIDPTRAAFVKLNFIDGSSCAVADSFLCTPRFEQFVPAGRSGWLRLFSSGDQGILGVAINLNPNAGGAAGAFNQGHNLHKLTLTTSAVYTIPIFPPSC